MFIGKQTSFFYEKYPNYHEIAEEFLDILSSSKIGMSFLRNKAFIYYNYMLILITTIPIKYLRNKAYICIDFSKEENYTN